MSKIHRIETADGVVKIECTKSNPLSEDCPQCNKEKLGEIEAWIRAHEKFCLYCDEDPKCYLCLRKECEEWMKDKHFIEQHGSSRGCPHLALNVYCEDFVCKYGFDGWWIEGWRETRRRVRKKAWANILRNKQRAERLRRRKMKEAKNAKKPKKTKRNTRN